jgi:hypothetical protein
MKSQLSSAGIINRGRAAGVVLTILMLAVATSAPVYAHGDYDHVRGTVVQASNETLTIKTAQGNLDVKLDAKTQITRDGQKAQAADLKPGARVIVDLPKGGKDKTAHSIQIGAVPKTAGTPGSKK